MDDDRTRQNRQWIAQQIQWKNMYATPYTSLANDVRHVRTDVDHFPYTRFYRGEYASSSPRVWIREAGFHPIQPNVYVVQTPEPTPLDTVFQVPCSTIFPVRHKRPYPLESQRVCTVVPP